MSDRNELLETQWRYRTKQPKVYKMIRLTAFESFAKQSDFNREKSRIIKERQFTQISNTVCPLNVDA